MVNRGHRPGSGNPGSAGAVTTRHEFLAQLHGLLKPRVYLEVGVQFGWSLNLAVHSQIAIGIDPSPLVAAKPRQSIYPMKADDYFVQHTMEHLPVDMAFIDGSHLFEDAASDFMHIRTVSHRGTVIVFDDVLPRNQREAARRQCPGDWTGDVWRVYPWLRFQYPGIQTILVDTEPTGLLVCLDVRTAHPYCEEGMFFSDTEDNQPVPDRVLKRLDAIQPADAYRRIERWKETL